MDFDSEEEALRERRERTENRVQWNKIAAPYFLVREIRIAIEAVIDVIGDPIGSSAKEVERCRNLELRLFQRCRAFDLHLLWETLSVDHQRLWAVEYRELKKTHPKEASEIVHALSFVRGSIGGVMEEIGYGVEK